MDIIGDRVDKQDIFLSLFGPGLFWLHLALTAFMTGLIWVIQLVHYPAFHFVAPTDFHAFHTFHSRRITWIVAPMMLAELLTGVLLIARREPVFYANAVGLAALWTVTALVSVPLHNRLAKARASVDIDRLTRTNWLRTGLWSGRLVALLMVAFRGL